MALDIKIAKHNQIPVLKLSGRIINIDVTKFSGKIESILQRNPGPIIIDLTETNFIDSHGLGILIYYHTKLENDKHELIILNSNQNQNSYVNRLFDLTNLNKVLRIVSSIDEIN